MAGPSAQEWQQKPSRLRNEMRHTPSDDSKVFGEEDVQVPDSQTAVPDTQTGSDPLSLRSVALLDHFTVKKNVGPASSPFFPVKLFAKESSLGESSFPCDASVRFAFGQPRNRSDKPLQKLKRPVAQKDNSPPVVEKISTGREYCPHLVKVKLTISQMRSLQARLHSLLPLQLWPLRLCNLRTRIYISPRRAKSQSRA